MIMDIFLDIYLKLRYGRITLTKWRIAMINENPRIQMHDNALSAVTKLSEGNPGALNVMMSLLSVEEDIDPDSWLGAMGTIFHFDTYGIYGSRIWMLYKDVCGEDLNTLVGICRAVQLSILDGDKLDHAIDNYGEGIDITENMNAVKETLPNFNIGEKYA